MCVLFAFVIFIKLLLDLKYVLHGYGEPERNSGELSFY